MMKTLISPIAALTLILFIKILSFVLCLPGSYGMPRKIQGSHISFRVWFYSLEVSTLCSYLKLKFVIVNSRYWSRNELWVYSHNK